jgi:ParB-like chromosome segregation protein Spo0J
MATLENSDRGDSFTIWPEGIPEILDPLNLKFQLRDVRGLARQIAEGGGEPGKPFQHTPVIVTKNKEGRTVMVDGRRRRAAIELINSDPAAFDLSGPLGLRAVLHGKLTDDDILTIQISANRDREAKNSPVDDARTVHILEQRFAWGRDRIARELRVTTARVRKLLDINDLPERVQVALHENRLKESHALLFAKLPSEQASAFMDDVESGATPAKVLASLKGAHRALGKKKPYTLHEVIKALREVGDDRAIGLLAWIHGDTEVGSLEDILR